MPLLCNLVRMRKTSLLRGVLRKSVYWRVWRVRDGDGLQMVSCDKKGLAAHTLLGFSFAYLSDVQWMELEAIALFGFPGPWTVHDLAGICYLIFIEVNDFDP